MIVAEALTYLERLSQDPAVDDALRLELANGYRRIGAVQGGLGEANLGDRAGAKVSYERAIKLLEPLASRPGAALRTLCCSAVWSKSFRPIYESVGERTAAIAAIKSATARLERLLVDHPTSPEVRTGLAAAVMRLGFGSSKAEAIVHFQRSLDLFEGLLQEKPDDPIRQRNVALDSKYLGARFEEKERARPGACALRARDGAR